MKKYYPVIYGPELRPNLQDFGIQIPLNADRVEQVLQALLQNPNWQSDRGQWLLSINPTPVSFEDLLLAHTEEYVNQLREDPGPALLATYELIGSDGQYNRYAPEKAARALHELRDYQLKHVRALQMAATMALEFGASYLLGGGLHHAMSFGGRGFCLVNDGVIVLKKMLKKKAIRSAWIIDVDAHKGDGTAELTQNQNQISTLSIHMARGWPIDEGPGPWHLPSTVDIPVASGEEGQYVAKLEAGLFELLKHAPGPDIALVVQGADPYEADTLPSTQSLKLTLEQMKSRDELVFKFLKERNIAQVYVMAGGYGPEVWRAYAQFLNFFLAQNPA